MQDKRKNTLKIALLGMDERTRKTLSLYLLGPCKNAGVTIADSNEAEVDIVDADLPKGRAVLDKLLENKSRRPLIVLSLKDRDDDGFLNLKKPIQREAMLAVLSEARKRVQSESNAKEPETASTLKQYVYVADLDEANKSSTHHTAMLMDENGLTASVIGLKRIDVENQQQIEEASYNPKEYFQGYVQAGYKIAKSKGQVMQLNTGWKRLIIFPHSNEVWLDADDKQLRVFAGMCINKDGNRKMSITALEPQSVKDAAVDNFQTMESLLWKLACWTSKGRYPVSCDINSPFYLKQWPNFTRLVVTPHAMRIAALLVDKPRSAINIAKELDINPEYVFVFISATSALGLLNQAVRNEDTVVAPPKLESNKKKGVLRRIINKLRSNKGITD